MTSSESHQGLQFPLTFQLKIIAENSHEQEWFIARFSEIFQSLAIGFGAFNTRPSANATYLSYSVTVTLFSQECYDRMYHELGRVESVRCVL